MSDGTRNRVWLLADSQTLTSTFADTSTVAEFDSRGAAQICVYVDYTRGTGEGDAFLEFKIQSSVDGTTFVTEGEWNDTDNTAITAEPFIFKVTPNSLNGIAPLIKPINAITSKIQICEQNFISNPGTATIRILMRYI